MEKAGVGPLASHELVVTPLLRDKTLIDDEDPVCTTDSTKTMRDENDYFLPADV